MTPHDATPLAGADGLARWLTRVAGSMALLLTLAAPAGYWLLVRQAEAREAELAARLQAAFLIQAIGGEAEGWADRVQGLVDVPLVTSALPEQRLVLTRRGVAVSAAGDAPPWPVVDGRAELSAGDVQLGEVSVRRSMRPRFLATAAVAAVAALFGLALFAVLRLLPLRALRRAFERLRAQETQERGRVEERLRIVLDNALDGVIVYRADGTLLSVNHAVQRMLGEGAALPLQFQDLLPGVTGIGQHQAELRRADGHGVPVDVGISDLALPGEPQRIAIVRDITERLRHEAKLAQMANYDPLTGLGNRSLFRERLVRALQRARHDGQRAALMFIDLDRFKQVNDTLGHGIGDQLLVAVVQRLAQSLRGGDEVALRPRSASGDDLFRLGGDEFTVLLSPAPREPDLAQVAQRLIDALQQPFEVGGNEIYISASIGITLDEGCSGPAGEQAAAVDVDTLVKQADLAMYRAKEMGRNGYFFFNDALDAGMRERHRLEGLLHRALARNEFLLHYQPKVDAHSGTLIGVEALLRWQSPDEGRLVSPLEFVPILEDSGLIASVGTWVLEEACRQLMDWQRQGLPPMSVAVNISARQLRQGDLAERVGAVLAATGVPAHLLELELTESMLIEDSEGVLALLKDLKQLGLRIAIDDFGTGHSSLAYLKRFDLDTLKIDRAFVRDTPHDSEDCAIARAIVALADGLGLHTVAEGVETTAQLEFLRGLGCRVIQGYLISKPLPAPALLAWARDRLAEATPA